MNMKSYRVNTLIALGTAALAVLVLTRLGSFPGFNGDEGFFGVTALDIGLYGVRSMSGMTWYTGTLYPALLARTFDVFGASLTTLRAFGAAGHVAAAAWLAWTLKKRVSPEAALAWLGLLAGSIFFSWTSRVAIEVFAVNMPLLFVAIAAIVTFLDQASSVTERRVAIGILFVSSYVGTYSHIVHLAVPVAFAGAACVLTLVSRSPRMTELAWASGLSCGLSCVWYFKQKPWMPTELEGFRYLFATLGVPLVAAGLALATAPFVVRLTLAVLKRAMVPASFRGSRPVRIVSFFGAFLGLTAPLVTFATTPLAAAFWTALTGSAVMQRMAGYEPTTAFRVVSYAYAGSVVVVFAAGLAKRTFDVIVRKDRVRAEDFVGVAAVGSTVILSFVVTSTTTRHCATMVYLLLAATATLGAGAFSGKARLVLLAPIVSGALLCGFHAEELSRETPRRPILFQLGNIVENSRHYLPNTRLLETLREAHVCAIDTPEGHAILAPFEFSMRANPWDCDPNARAFVRYCESCEETGYIEVRTARPRGPRGPR